MARTQQDPFAALDAEARRLFGEWGDAKSQVTEYERGIVEAKHILASPPSDVDQLDAWRAERQRAERVIAEAALVLPALERAATTASLAWSSAWSAAAAQLRAELLDPVLREREAVLARLDEREAAARAELARRTQEMPAA